jgi:DNA-binding MarR family transcriptional regulator
MAAVGLKTTQYSLLTALARAGSMRAVDLARVLSLEASTLTRNLEPLVEAGWIESAPGADRRTRVLHLTPAGRAHRRRASAHWRAAQRDLAAALGCETIATLHALLDHCQRVLGGDDAGSGTGTDETSGTEGSDETEAANAGRPRRGDGHRRALVADATGSGPRRPEQST